MIKDTDAGTMLYRIIDTSKLKIPDCFYTDVFDGSHINIVIRNRDDELNAVDLSEISIADAFYDFLTSTVSDAFLYSKEDTLRTLRSALEKVRGE